MKVFFVFVAFCLALSLSAQEIDIQLLEEPPYYVDQQVNLDVYLKNTTQDTLVYFDSRGPCWESFVEEWNLNVNCRFVEIIPLNGAYNNKFTDSTFITIYPDQRQLIRSKIIPLHTNGFFSLTYSQNQGASLVNKEYADTTVTDSILNSVSTFQVSNNIQFEVLNVYDTIIHEIVNMSWDDWKDYRNVKMYSQEHHFDNMYAALKYPQDVYALTLYCNGLDEETIRLIGKLKNIRALTLRNYPLDFFPEEIAKLDLYELTIIPKDETAVDYSKGLSKNNTIRELTAKFYNGIPEQLLKLNKLIKLDIKDCPIGKLPKLDSLQNLEELIANNTELESINKVGFSSLKKLKKLTLSGNKNIDKIEPLLECKNLEFLIINRTSIRTIPHEIEKLQKLKRFSISNKLTEISDSIGNLSDMRYFSLGGNRSLEVMPQSIIKMKKLLHLDISSTKIKKLPEGIAELPLEKVFIYNTEVENSKDYKQLKNRLGDKFKD